MMEPLEPSPQQDDLSLSSKHSPKRTPTMLTSAMLHNKGTNTGRSESSSTNRRTLFVIAAGSLLVLAQIYSLYANDGTAHRQQQQRYDYQIANRAYDTVKSVEELTERVDILEFKLENHLLQENVTITNDPTRTTGEARPTLRREVESSKQIKKEDEPKKKDEDALDLTPLVADELKQQQAAKPDVTKPASESSVSATDLVRDLDNKPTMVYNMHVPKTGGRTAMFTMTDWNVNRRINCWLAWCCGSFPKYIDAVDDILNKRANTTGEKAGQCQAISQEISVPGILKTKELLDKTQERWYMYSFFGNPMARYLSITRHHIRENRCEGRYQPEQLTSAIETRLSGKCHPKEQDDQDQAQYYFRAPWNPNPPYWYFPTRNITFPSDVPDAWTEMKTNFDWVGLTHHMDESFCVLALEMAVFDFLPMRKAQTICTKQQEMAHVKSTKKGDPDTDPVTTLQVLRILKQEVPVDVQVYPHLLQAFHDKLQLALRVIQKQAGGDVKETTTRFQSVMTSVLKERQAWLKVSSWVTAAADDNEAKLLEQLESLTSEEKNLIAPKMKWGQSPALDATASSQ